MKKRYSEEQIIGFLRDGEAGIAVKDLCRKHGFSEASYYLWKSKFGGMSVSDAKRLKELETENARHIGSRDRAIRLDRDRFMRAVINHGKTFQTAPVG